MLHAGSQQLEVFKPTQPGSQLQRSRRCRTIYMLPFNQDFMQVFKQQYMTIAYPICSLF